MQKSWHIDAPVVVLYRNWESWAGSFYELGMAYKSEAFTEDMHLFTMQWLWSDPSLLGVVKSPDQYGQPWYPIDPSSLAESVHSYGCIRFPHGQIVGCGSLSIISEEMTWLILYIPLGMLDSIFPIHYPVTRDKNPWITQVDAFLATIGNRVYRASPFLFAVMGEEAGAFPLKTIFADIMHDPGLLVSETLFQQLGVHPYGECLSQGLWWTGGQKKEQ